MLPSPDASILGGCRQLDGVCGIASSKQYSTQLAYACSAKLACDSASGTLVGCCVLHTASGLAALGIDLPTQQPSDKQHAACEVLYASNLLMDPEHESEALQVLLANAFAASPTLKRIAFIAEKQIPLSQPYLAAMFISESSAQPDEGEKSLSSCTVQRDAVLGQLAVRSGTVEDADELWPLLQSAQASYGRLAQVRPAPLCPSLVMLHALETLPCLRIRAALCKRGQEPAWPLCLCCEHAACTQGNHRITQQAVNTLLSSDPR